MTNLREAEQMALDALERINRALWASPSCQVGVLPTCSCANCASEAAREAMRTLRAALAQPEQEPVAWWHDRGDFVDLNVSGHGTPLYFNPPQREWQGLTDEEISNIWGEPVKFMYSGHYNAIRAIEAKLKEKNS